MPRLTPTERLSFTPDKLLELDRMSTARQEALLDPTDIDPKDKNAVRAKVVGKWANSTVDQLRMQVNIESYGTTLTYTPENNYTRVEQDALGYAWKANNGRKAEIEIPAILSQNVEMIVDGLDVNTRKAILKARGGT